LYYSQQLEGPRVRVFEVFGHEENAQAHLIGVLNFRTSAAFEQVRRIIEFELYLGESLEWLEETSPRVERKPALPQVVEGL
jgi:hypothetical protein